MLAAQPLNSHIEFAPPVAMRNGSSKLVNRLRPLIAEFGSQIGYIGADSSCDLDLDSLVQGMHRQAAIIGIPYPEGSYEWHCFKISINYARFCYPNVPVDVRVYTGIYCWLALFVDDWVCKDLEQWQHFIRRYQSGAKQHTLVAQAWADHLRLSYKYYSPIVANFIVTASLNYTNANVLEGLEVPRMTRTAGGESWPDYLRDKDGVSEAFVWLTFPNELYPDVSRFMEAVPDMAKYLSWTNDILSFYKEEKLGEKDNYIHSRASYEGKDVFRTFEDIIKDDVGAVHRIQLSLRGKGPSEKAFRDHIMGFVTFHVTAERYKLSDLGLGEDCSDVLPMQKI